MLYVIIVKILNKDLVVFLNQAQQFYERYLLYDIVQEYIRIR